MFPIMLALARRNSCLFGTSKGHSTLSTRFLLIMTPARQPGWLRKLSWNEFQNGRVKWGKISVKFSFTFITVKRNLKSLDLQPSDLNFFATKFFKHYTDSGPRVFRSFKYMFRKHVFLCLCNYIHKINMEYEKWHI